MISENSKTTDPHRIILNLTDKINLNGMVNMLLYEILASTTHGKK